FSFCQPEKSKEEHQLFLEIEDNFMQKLKLPHQIVHLCTGDMGLPSASTFDIETWMPSQGKFRETHSTSNCTDFQARRLNIKYKPQTPNPKPQKLDFVHTVNGTAFAIPRMLIAIIENYQQKDGSIKIPEVLQKYIGKKIIKRT
ncbi:MAG TPA: serine--tRNA ligase, partial [Candidatus Pacearchaeota archaeon]|nr:serine--tRNA ligase [Candidatus Pacearchaeota archaeon]